MQSDIVTVFRNCFFALTLPDSPPCQPFCRVGKQMDIEDPRSLSFLHLLSLLETVTDPPDHLFVENVRGFEGSRVHQRLLEVRIWLKKTI